MYTKLMKKLVQMIRNWKEKKNIGRKEEGGKKPAMVMLTVLLGALLVTGCSGDGMPKKPEYFQPQSQNREDADTQDTEKKEDSSYEYALLMSLDMVEETLVVHDYASDRDYTYHFDLSTRFLDKYGDYTSETRFVPGTIVKLGERDGEGTLKSLQLSPDVWVYEDVSNYSYDIQRPDKAAFSLLEGRVVVLSDNSPVALILPCDYNSFLKTTDDYYNRWDMATFARILRFFSSFFAMTLPGLYLALTNFHTQILPTSLLLAFQEAREGVPFPTVLEVLLMELSFELLREAGVRLPGAMGSTIGIVGGLIIGQAAVDAHLVSPIVVILVSFTALCSFAIPSEEFAYAFRVLKFLVIFASAWLGYFGFLVSITVILFHLARLKSFGIPYLTPFSGGDINGDLDKRDALWRYPLQKNNVRPIYARRNQRVRLRRKKTKNS